MTEQSKKEILNIYQRILAVMADVSYIEKEKKTVNNQYRFVSHDAVTSATSEAFIKHGVYAKPRIIKNEITTIQIEKYNKYEKITLKENSFVCTVEVEYDFINVDNPADRITGINGLGQGIDNQDKACGKAISYACKYALLKALGIETGDDPEKDINYKITTQQSDEKAKVNTITSDQAFHILDLLKEAGVDKELFCNSYKIDTVIQLQVDKYDNAISRLKKKIAENGVVNANN
jgi:hypothetical protein